MYGGAGFEAWNTLSVGPSALAVLSLAPPPSALSSGSTPPPKAAEEGGDGDWCWASWFSTVVFPWLFMGADLLVYWRPFWGFWPATGAANGEGIAAILVIKCCIERRPDINILMTMTTLSAFHCFLGKWGKKAAEATKKAEDPVGDMWQHCTMYGGLIDARFKSQDHGVKSAPPHSTIEKTFGGNHISTPTTQFRIWLCTMRSHFGGL